MTSQRNDGVDLSIRLFCEAWRLMCSGCSGQSVAAGDGIEYTFSGLPIGFFNVAILTGQTSACVVGSPLQLRPQYDAVQLMDAFNLCRAPLAAR